MGRISIKAVAAAPLAVGFAFVDDYRTVPQWMFGVTGFTPVGEQERGLGAEYAVTMVLGPKTLRSKVRVTEWEQDELITLESYEGVRNTSSWRFTRVDDEHAELSVEFTYDFGGGLAGKALGRIVEPFVQAAVAQTEKDLRRLVEQRYFAVQED
ncbi:SRPBCC family protein [Tomitella fengzijianii]|uniref:SRPBCC family protein n=1 Tax=Tomitella fengzijianii TaxID=2597660 RepID=UPI001E3FCCF5|nr:SRPBCC family protein [Tomitella fengzijianii]